MGTPWKARSFAVEGLVGYRRIEWGPIHPELNLLIGQNGVGKSMLLETLVAALNYIQGRHSRDTFIGRMPGVSIELHLAGEEHARKFTTAEINAQQGAKRTDYECQILQVVENRQPKNRFGREGPPHTSNPLMRYPDALAKVQRILRSGTDEDIALAKTIEEYCLCLDPVASPAEWRRILRDIRERTPSVMRPVSCGQFDVIALVLDLALFQRDLLAEPKPHFLILDNPETYLHPAAVGPMLDLYRRALPDGQFFLATHGVRGVFYPEHKSVFFLSREARSQPIARIEPLHRSPAEARTAFFELYGPSEGAGLLSVMGELTSPTYYRFLAECVHECSPKGRRDPGTDRQLRHTLGLQETAGLTVLDLGAGYGDLLAALEAAGDRGVTYVAVDPQPQDTLAARLSGAIERGTATPESSVLTRLGAVRAPCDVAVLLNLCHHLGIPDLADTLAQLLGRLVRRVAGCGVIIVELRTLATGEQDFLLWTPDDFKDLLAPWPELTVARHPLDGEFPEEGHEATTIRWNCDPVHAAATAAQLEDRLWAILPTKRVSLLREIELLLEGPIRTGLGEYWRQKRVAFCCAALAWIARTEWLHTSS